MNTLRIALACTAAFAASACTTMNAEPAAPAAAPVAATPPATAAAPTQSEHDRLFALFAADDEASLRLNPLSALFRGDLRYADRLGDFLLPEYNAALRKQAQDNLAALARIDRAALSETDQIAYDVFKYNQEEALKGLTPEILALTEVRPVNHFFGFHTFYPNIESGSGAAPFKTVKDYENAISRHGEYVELTDRSIAKFREGMGSGVLSIICE